MAVPPATPVTTPELVTVAIVALLLLHVPPVVASLNAVVEPGHTVGVPVMAAGGAAIVMASVGLVIAA